MTSSDSANNLGWPFRITCKRGHAHASWDERFRCDHDRVSPRDAEGRLIESPAPPQEQPQQAALELTPRKESVQ